MKEGHVTIYDVAALAGVHASTASRALAGLRVKKANLAAVEKAAAELGYVPSAAARSLRMVRTMTVGMVFNQLTSALGVELLGSVSAALEKAGYSLFISTAQGSSERYDQLLRRFIEHRVDALLCVHGRGECPTLDRYIGGGIPALALITKDDAFGKLPLVTPSIAGAAAACIAALQDQGHRSIGVVDLGRPLNLIEDTLSAAGRYGVRLKPMRDEAGAIDANALLAQVIADPAGPTVIIALLADAVALMTAADRAGVAIPERLSLVAIRDRSVLSQPTSKPLSMIHVEPARAGAVAAQTLLAWLDDKIAPTADIAVAVGSWRPASSTGFAANP